MGQILIPSTGGITVIPADRESGPGAGGGASGNRDLFLGALAGFNSTASDLIALGNNAMAGGLADTNLNGTIVIGSQSMKSLVNTTPPSVADSPSLIVGYNIAPNIQNRIGGSVMLGPNIYSNAVTGTTPAETIGSVLIGAEVIGNNRCLSTNGPGANNCVIIGYQGAKGVATTQTGAGSQIQTSVLLGSQVCYQTGFDGPTPGSQIAQCVVIGFQAGSNMGQGQNNTGQLSVIIGYQCLGAASQIVNSCIMIGAGITQTNNSNNNIVIGTGITANYTTVGRNVIIGDAASIGVGIGGRNIVLGAGSGTDIPGAGNDYFVVETNDGTKRAAVFAQMSSGNIVLGNSSTAQRDLVGIGGTNQVKLVNGTRGAGNPNTGGFFYVSGGLLRWVDSAGVETALSVNAAGQLANTTTAYTNNAAAQAATITNGPTAGNPTKWIPINDNGTIRNIPAW